MKTENQAKQHRRVERTKRKAQFRLQKVAISEQNSDVKIDTLNRHWTRITIVFQRSKFNEVTNNDELSSTQAHRNTSLERNTLKRHVQEVFYDHDNLSSVQENISAHDENAASSTKKNVAASVDVVTSIDKDEDEDLANDVASSLSSEDETSTRNSISFSFFSFNFNVATSTHSVANFESMNKRMLNATYVKMQTLVSVTRDKVLKLHSFNTYATMTDLDAHLDTTTCNYFMKTLKNLQIVIKNTTWFVVKQSYRLLIWFLIILLMIFLECEKYIYLVDSQRSNIDLISNLICKISESRTACRVLICRMFEIDRLFSSICRMIDESVAIARILQKTYDLFVNMIDLNTVMHQISTNLTNHKQNLDFQIERFKVIQDDLAIFDDVKMKFLENQKYIYNTLLLMSNYLMRFYDHVNDVANVILFEINVITNDVAQILSNNFTNLIDQNYYKTQKTVNKRCLNHVATWKTKMQFLITFDEIINAKLIRLKIRVNVLRNNLQIARKQTENKKLKIIWDWSYHTRFFRWLSRFYLLSWLKIAVFETKEVEAYDEILKSLDDLLFEIQKLKRLFTSLWSQITQINYDLEQLVFKLSAQNFRFRSDHEDFVQLQSFLKKLNRNVEDVRLTIKHNDEKMIEMNEVTTNDDRVD